MWWALLDFPEFKKPENNLYFKSNGKKKLWLDEIDWLNFVNSLIYKIKFLFKLMKAYDVNEKKNVYYSSAISCERMDIKKPLVNICKQPYHIMSVIISR